MLDGLLKRFEDPRQFRALPPDARPLYITGAHFARGAFAVFREDGRAALQSADALDASGLKLYAMIASHLRFLYYANRGELALAARHREQVELHAAHVGSAWQVETWEAAALIPLHTSLGDIVALTRAVDRLALLGATVPSLRLYAQMAEMSLGLVRGDWNEEQLAAVLGDRAPRSFIGWASVIGFHAMGCNERGLYAQAKATCESGLAHVTDADREYVSLFLMLEDPARARRRGSRSSRRGARPARRPAQALPGQRPSPGSRIPARGAGSHRVDGRSIDEYDVSLAVVERWFRPTGTPALVARWERLAELKGPVASRREFPAPDSGSRTDPAVKTETNPLGTVPEPDARTVRIVLRKSESA